MKSTLARYFTIFFIGLCVIIFVFLIVITNHIEKIIFSQIENDLLHQVLISEEIFKGMIQGQDIDGVDRMTKNLAQRLEVRITVIDTTGRVLADSDHDPASMDNHINRPEVMMAFNADHGYAVRYSNTLGIDLLYVAKRIGNEQPLGFLRFSMPLYRIQSFHHNIRVWIYGAGIILLGLSLLLGYFSLVSLRRPMTDIAEFTKQLAGGNFKARLLNPAKGDVQEIYRNLNTMAEKLQESFSTISRERDILASVLSAMAEAVIVLDHSDQIIIANRSFRNMLSPEHDPIGKTAWEIVRNNDFADFVSKCKTTEKHMVSEIRIPEQGKIYSVSGYFIPLLSGWTFVFNDITEARNIERMKADFVTNLSHELRTPLTSLKGFLETMEDPNISIAEQKKFLRIIKANAERMISLVSDLSALSDFERPERKQLIEKFDLNELAENVITLFAKEAKTKSIKLGFEKKKIPKIEADRFMIEQLLINLVSNSVRFTEKGEVKLDIDFKADKFFIMVRDTGIGIPESEMPRIFERFYTVDKVRSRAQGGTGLGLSIVKHIVQAHHGEIKVESKIGQGSKFTIILPI